MAGRSVARISLIFSPSPATFEAQKAIELLEKIRPELEKFSKRLDQILKTPDLATLSKEDLHFLAAAYARHLYSRLNFNLGFFLYGKAFELPDTVKQYEQLLKQGESDVKTVAALVRALQSGQTLDPAFFSGLALECRYLPAVVRCYVSDLLQVTARYRGGFNYISAGFAPNEAIEWNKRNISPLDAAFWSAYDFDPATTDAWRKNGVSLHNLAAEWRDAGFTPTTATPWLSYGFPPAIAKAWNDANYEPTAALSYIQRGTRDPKQIKS